MEAGAGTPSSELSPLEAAAWRYRVGIAGALSGLLPGAGQLFAGRPVRATVAFAGVAAVAVVSTVSVVCWRLTPFTLVIPLLVTLIVHLVVVGDAVRQARRAGRGDRRWRSVWLHGALLIAVTGLSGPVIGAVAGRLVGIHVVDGATMAHTLLPGDVVAVARVRCGPPQPGDVVVVETARGVTSVSRCVARAGSEVAVRAGILYVDDTPIQPPFDAEGAWGRVRAKPDMPARTVADGRVALLGDNRGPQDSGGWKLDVVEIEHARGTAGFILWSASPEDGVRWLRLGLPVEHSLVPVG
jgi:signal peptidase I